ncbi:hypothetical protein K4F52_005554 [Lecanicillium sp. MT-2017a]|nr:hypothetical protein K4F52_005554 [Lecanicillium sp. MT-2017a]
MTTHGPQSPLLAGNTNPKAPRAAGTVPPSTKTIVTALSVLKVVFGLGLIAAPGLLCKVFLLDPIEPQTAVICRLYGSACIGLGYLTWMLNRAHTLEAVDKSVLKHAVVVNIAADAMDVISCLVGYFGGLYGLDALGVLGGGCFALEALGFVAYSRF